ncbi:MAG: CPBP family intramembrane metalloprotease [Ruminococcaceae bacterium]|nr:CPBP family intramembrane metalloprotease [Oscillospiraceae bacterium]
MRTKRLWIVGMVCAACLCMGVVDAVLQPGYVVKSLVKLALFLALPLAYARLDRDCDLRALFRAERKGVLAALGAGVFVYAVILAAFFLLRRAFDFSALTGSLTAQTGVRRENFLWAALYISFVNSLLEEFFFRGFAFLTLKAVSGRRFAYAFSALAFALYHLAMMLGWFSPVLLLLALAGLFVGGLIFDRFDEGGGGNIYLSWLVHMFANFATNTVGFLLFSS